MQSKNRGERLQLFWNRSLAAQSTQQRPQFCFPAFPRLQRRLNARLDPFSKAFAQAMKRDAASAGAQTQALGVCLAITFACALELNLEHFEHQSASARGVLAL